ncbi:hypothetical protein C874_00230 [Elizabethkingia anophelis 502]|nr:hypothetical protein C874_00230 [Elizabethkingia anophelis 502]
MYKEGETETSFLNTVANLFGEEKPASSANVATLYFLYCGIFFQL